MPSHSALHLACLFALFPYPRANAEETSRPVPPENQVATKDSTSSTWKYPPEFEDAVAEVYKEVDKWQLKIFIFKPQDHDVTDERPAAVFFFGGGWRGGTPQQFEEQCRYLASRGMIAMTADYRVLSRHGTKADACVEDGKSAVRWVRENARQLGVDPNRIVAGGGSAGGHVAACTGCVPGFEAHPSAVSSRPNAMALFNPALILALVPEVDVISAQKVSSLRPRLGTEPETISPYHQLGPDLPPTIVFHGKSDTTVSYRSAEMFAKKAESMGSRMRLIGYDNQVHGFFNFGRGQNKMFVATMRELDRFLVELGYLKGEATIDEWVSK